MMKYMTAPSFVRYSESFLKKWTQTKWQKHKEIVDDAESLTLLRWHRHTEYSKKKKEEEDSPPLRIAQIQQLKVSMNTKKSMKD